MRSDSLLRFWRYINHLLTYLLTYSFKLKSAIDTLSACFPSYFLPSVNIRCVLWPHKSVWEVNRKCCPRNTTVQLLTSTLAMGTTMHSVTDGQTGIMPTAIILCTVGSAKSVQNTRKTRLMQNNYRPVFTRDKLNRIPLQKFAYTRHINSEFFWTSRQIAYLTNTVRTLIHLAVNGNVTVRLWCPNQSKKRTVKSQDHAGSP